MTPLQSAFASCPLCGGESASFVDTNCTKHPLWHEPLPTAMHWMVCSGCQHMHTRDYWTDAGLAELFRSAHAEQLSGAMGNPDMKRAGWMLVVERAMVLLGGYRAVTKASLPASWVDVGCGDGALAMTAADFGFAALGLDARAEAVQRLRAVGFRTQQGDFMQVDFREKVDVLSMMDVLEHIPFPGKALAKAARVIRPGGVLVLSMPDLYCSSWRVLDIARANPYWTEIEHHHNFSRVRLQALLEANGFEVADFAIPNRYKAQMEVYAVRQALP